jgi:RNA polymerase sigma-70 factor, ECF subfamily
MEICCEEFRDDVLQSLWGEMHERLLHFIVSRIDNHDDAQDILQNVFIKIHSGLDSVRDTEKLESWVFQITRNSITDFYRQPGRFLLDEALPIYDDYAIDDPTSEVARYIHDIVRSLPEIYRQAVELVDIRGMNQKDAARDLGISVSGMKSRVQRGRAMVREIMLACCHFEFDSQGIVMEYYDCCCFCQNK